MAYISNQWLKGGKGYHPVLTEIKGFTETTSWDKEHNIIYTIDFCKTTFKELKCQNEKCSNISGYYEVEGSITHTNTCWICGSNFHVSRIIKCNEKQSVSLTKSDIESILPDLLINASEKSRIDILEGVIPNMSDEAKFGLIKLLLKDSED
jgi:hypothetical protein